MKVNSLFRRFGFLMASAISVSLATVLCVAAEPLSQQLPSEQSVAPTATEAPAATSTIKPAATATGGTVHAPIKAGSVMALDLPDSSAKSISLDIQDGRFSDYSVGRIVLTAQGMDFRNGSLQALTTRMTNGNFDNMPVDHLNIDVPAFTFDTMQLLNSRTFVLSKPVTGKVSLGLSEAGINKFLTNPKTLSKIEKSLTKQTGGLKLVTFSNPNFTLLSGNKIKLTVTSTVAQGLTVPLEMLGKLAIQQGQLVITGMTMNSAGNNVQLPVDLASTFEHKLNELIDFRRLGKNALVINADSMKQSGKNIMIDGHATIARLQFG